MNQTNDCVFLERPVPARECLIRKIAAKKRDEKGHGGFDPCLHCDKVQTKGETMSKRAMCVDCKEEDSMIVSHGRCYKCLKKAREAGVVPPAVPYKNQKKDVVNVAVGKAVVNGKLVAIEDGRAVAVPAGKNVKKAAPTPRAVEKALPAMPLVDIADLASFASSLAIVAEDLSVFALELQAKAERIHKAAGFVSEARKIMRAQLPR